MNGIQNFDPTVLEFLGRVDAIKELHQGEQGVVGVCLLCLHIVVLSFFRLFTGGDLCGDVAGSGLDGGEDAVAFAAGGIEVGGFEGDAVAFSGAGVGVEGEVEPPGSVVVPEVVVGVVFGAAGG